MRRPWADTSDAPAVAISGLLGLGLIVAAADGGLYALIPRVEASVLVWWTLTLALTFGLMPRAVPTRPVVAALVALAGLAVWVAVGVLWTESVERTMAELARVLGFTGMVVLAAGCFPAKAWRTGVVAVSVAAVAVCAIALVSRLAP